MYYNSTFTKKNRILQKINHSRQHVHHMNAIVKKLSWLK